MGGGGTRDQPCTVCGQSNPGMARQKSQSQRKLSTSRMCPDRIKLSPEPSTVCPGRSSASTRGIIDLIGLNMAQPPARDVSVRGRPLKKTKILLSENTSK